MQICGVRKIVPVILSKGEKMVFLLQKRFICWRSCLGNDGKILPNSFRLLFSFLLCFFCLIGTLNAKVTGLCSNCHTMHNSQDNAAMATLGGEPGITPNAFLTRGSCVGCHAMGNANKIESLGINDVPQVMHTDGSGDLAGGNFAYILGMKGSGASDAKGHNVIDFDDDDGNLDGPPGSIKQFFHDNVVNDGNLTCAGTNGCHGYRNDGKGSGTTALVGAHHGNVDGKCDTASEVGDSYRFLLGVKGLENQTDKWQNKSETSHNEYFGQPSPQRLGCNGGDLSCHGAGGIRPPSNTISEFCATCHGNFHTLETATSDGVGSGVSPFIRHPTDYTLPDTDEYASYTAYSTEAPIARIVVPDTASATVMPGSDTVMCLSCHAAHATDYPDMLRWDYGNMVAHNAGASAGTGCFVCHTTKDD